MEAVIGKMPTFDEGVLLVGKGRVRAKKSTLGANLTNAINT